MGDLTRAATAGESLSHIVTATLSQYLNKPIHTLFQVSTSGALVAGIYSPKRTQVRLKSLLQRVWFRQL